MKDRLQQLAKRVLLLAQYEPRTTHIRSINFALLRELAEFRKELGTRGLFMTDSMLIREAERIRYDIPLPGAGAEVKNG